MRCRGWKPLGEQKSLYLLPHLFPTSLPTHSHLLLTTYLLNPSPPCQPHSFSRQTDGQTTEIVNCQIQGNKCYRIWIHTCTSSAQDHWPWRDCSYLYTFILLLLHCRFNFHCLVWHYAEQSMISDNPKIWEKLRRGILSTSFMSLCCREDSLPEMLLFPPK